jgi:hypothetical protein
MFAVCRPLRRLFLCLPLIAVYAVSQTGPMTTVQEVRWSDSGWGPYNDRNLVGRFTTQTFTIPRLSQIQDCYLRQYDSSTPPKYPRYSVALHLDYPLS